MNNNLLKHETFCERDKRKNEEEKKKKKEKMMISKHRSAFYSLLVL